MVISLLLFLDLSGREIGTVTENEIGTETYQIQVTGVVTITEANVKVGKRTFYFKEGKANNQVKQNLCNNLQTEEVAIGILVQVSKEERLSEVLGDLRVQILETLGHHLIESLIVAPGVVLKVPVVTGS